ncbi:MAG: hypothetical protein GY759_06270 [Chloroflexi bacterium]|nr:hypothetical protein [Chloroflexota bacterium]
MSDNSNELVIWRSMLEVGASLTAHLSPTLRYYENKTGIGGWSWFTLLRVRAFEPTPTTIEGLLLLSPYDSAGRYRPHLNQALKQAYLLEQPTGTFCLTDTGRLAVDQFIADLRAVMVAFDPLSLQEGGRLAHCLKRLVQASLLVLPAAAPAAITHSYRLMPDRSPSLPFIEQCISCLAAYRDDCHIAAWQPGGLAGPALEALTLLIRGRADSLQSLHVQLVRRAQPRQAYRAALVELRERGYIEGPDDALIATEPGRDYRQQVEEETDRLFFKPWAGLDESELNDVHDLLILLGDGLQREDHKPNGLL